MTLLKERGRSDDNDARAFLLSNTAEERVELLRIVCDREELLHNAGDFALRDVVIFRFRSRPVSLPARRNQGSTRSRAGRIPETSAVFGWGESPH
jgi:hypothetical protein